MIELTPPRIIMIVLRAAVLMLAAWILRGEGE